MRLMLYRRQRKFQMYRIRLIEAKIRPHFTCGRIFHQQIPFFLRRRQSGSKSAERKNQRILNSGQI